MLGSSETHYTPSRLLPYVFARRPIFAVMNAASDATTLLERHGAARLVAYDANRPPNQCVGEMAAALIEWLRQPRLPDLPEPGPEWDAFTARSLTERVAALFDRALEAPAAARPTARAAQYEHV
jgi:hypothetical protein